MADYQVTFTLNSAFTGTTEADSFTIVGKHANGSPADTIIDTGVSKADLTAGVTYTVVDTITGGTITSTGICTNSVPWTGLSGGGKDDPDPAINNFVFLKCSNDGEAPNSVIITKANWDTLQGGSSLPTASDTITVDGNGNFVNTVVFRFDSVTSDPATHTPLTEGDTCPNDEIIRD